MTLDSPEPPFVSIIIPVYNDREGLRKCLTALSHQSYPSHRFEVLVVDNGSSPPLDEVVAEFGVMEDLHFEDKKGSYAARNKGLHHAKGDILGFTDADCIPDARWIERGVAAIRSEGPLCFVGGRIQVFPPGDRPPSAFDLYDMIFAFPQQTYVEDENFSATANLFTTQMAMEKTGFFDPTLHSGGDNEWGKRATAAGIRGVYRDDVVVNHPSRSTYRQHVKKIRRTREGVKRLQRERGRRIPAEKQQEHGFLAKVGFGFSVLGRVWSPEIKISFPERVRASYAASVLNFVMLSTDIRLKLKPPQE